MTKPFYRRITEAFPHFDSQARSVQAVKKALKSRNIKELTEGYSFVFLSISLFILALYAAVSFIDYSNGRAEWLKARDNFAYWQEVAEKQKNSPDAYYQAAIYATELRDNQAAVGYLDKALELDPGFEKASELEKQLTHSTR